LSPIAAREKIRNGIMIECQEEVVGEKGNGDECRSAAISRQADPVLTDRH
jgi:hypothetical protein